jgi:hypothetical protein
MCFMLSADILFLLFSCLSFWVTPRKTVTLYTAAASIRATIARGTLGHICSPIVLSHHGAYIAAWLLVSCDSRLLLYNG